MLRVGLIGFGLAGQAFHAPLITSVDGMELACVLERRGSSAHEKYPQARIARSLDQLLEDQSIRLCVIATPNLTHFDLAELCLRAGRDVVVDKPFTVTPLEARELIRVADSHKRLLTVFQNRRWDGDFLTVRKLLAAGTLGRVVEYESNYDRFRPQLKPGAWRESEALGSGVLYDLGSHLFDQALSLFGTPQGVTGNVLRERDGARVDDAFDVRFHYRGLNVTLRATMLAQASRPRFRLDGTAGSFVKTSFDPQEARLRNGEIPADPGWGEDPESDWGTLYLADGEPYKVKTENGDYRQFYVNVRDAILNGAPLAVTARDGWQSIRAIELVRRSSDERRTISWDDGNSAEPFDA
jgi:predicted dehydrogenase